MIVKTLSILIMLCAMILAPASELLAQKGVTVRTDEMMDSDRQDKSPGDAKSSVTATVVSLSVKDSTLGYVLRELGKQAKKQVIYVNSNPVFARRVSVTVNKVSLSDAFAVVLKGTSLAATVTPGGNTIVISSPDQRPETSDTLSKKPAVSVSGKITDSASKLAIPGATVAISGTSLSTVSDDDGNFTIYNVPLGERQLNVKLFGYKSVNHSVSVTSKDQLIRIVMVPIATSLTGVVTTATGTQRKLEVGNDITVIKVDSVMKVMPVSSLTDLLATRVPGLNVSPTSGSPGAPSRIRIRGVSSINATNDPIVIMDGIRINAVQIENSENEAGDASRGSNQLVPSPLDGIDPNSIETVEVFKGPSAVALYGTDAANGVIVITTKRGQAGPTRWTAEGIWGQSTMPGKWPSNYMRFGTTIDGTITDCAGNREATSPFGGPAGCKGIDGSLLEYQILNDPHTTVFGKGSNQTYRGTISGGVRGLTYSFSGSAEKKIGLTKMPDVDFQILRELGTHVPAWQRRPEGSEMQTGMGNLTAEIGMSRILFTSRLTRNFVRTTPLKQAISIARLLDPAGVDLTRFGFESNPYSAIGSGILREIGNFREQTTNRSIRTINSLQGQINPYSWLMTTVTAGIDLENMIGVSKIGRGECTELFGDRCGSGDDLGGSAVLGNGGRHNTSQGTIIQNSFIVGASIPVSLNRWISLKTSIGGDYQSRRTDKVSRKAEGLSLGATSGNVADRQIMSESRGDRRTAGVYVETILGFANQFYFPFAIRADAGSGLGESVMPKFPKLNPSFLVSDLPGFHSIPFIGKLGTVRLRAAYGQSGVQPSVAEKLRTYTRGSGIVDGTSVATTDINSLGNLLLRPERTTEIEGGADIDMLDGRLSLSLTKYRKRTLDAYVTIDVPNSVNGGGKQMRNVGNVDNSGEEIGVQATLLQKSAIWWHLTFNLTRTKNELIKLGRDSLFGVANGGVQTRFVEGYPLFGQWALPIVGYSDLNGDGWITGGGLNIQNEIQLGETPVYLGAPYPKYETSLHSTLSLFRNISVGFAFNFQNGFTQKLDSYESFSGSSKSKALNDPRTPFFTQAYSSAAGGCSVSNASLGGTGVGSPGRTTLCSSIGVVQTVYALRFNNLSVGYTIPRSITSLLGTGRKMRVALQGKNLGLWSNYTGKDPKVNSSMSEVLRDTGVLPPNREWQITIGVN